jgi:hypothetical protein
MAKRKYKYIYKVRISKYEWMLEEKTRAQQFLQGLSLHAESTGDTRSRNNDH